jgi:hypothetical protein
MTTVPRIGRVLDLAGLALLGAGGAVWARAWLGFRSVPDFEPSAEGPAFAAVQLADGFWRLQRIGVALMVLGVGVFVVAWWVARRAVRGEGRPASAGGGHVVSASRIIDALPATVYGVIADYREGHTAILPKPPFVSLEVEEGGRGAGTLIRVVMRVMGRTQTFRARVSEPEPGRTIVETNDTGYVTTFTVEPTLDGRSRVTISTELERHGVVGALERWAAARTLGPVYRRELELLAGATGADETGPGRREP